jgi:hypothetical protein
LFTSLAIVKERVTWEKEESKNLSETENFGRKNKKKFSKKIICNMVKI